MVRDVLTDRHLPQLAEDAMLVVSELATNAVRHARSGLAVTLANTPARGAHHRH
jgi:anti-sigma regulatory factor (Ser/Thr protein kinase)